jgi:hypothetical protein
MASMSSLFSPENIPGIDPTTAAAVATILAAFFVILFIIGVLVYVYTSWAWMTIARKTNTKPVWLAWIPIANFYQRSKIARMHWWPLLLLLGGLVPFLSLITTVAFWAFIITWNWRSFERVHRPGWWALFLIFPIVGWIIYLALLGIVAWGKK